MADRTSKAVRGHAGISKVQTGTRIGYMVSYRMNGKQRTKTLNTLKAAIEFQASVRDPVRAREVRRLEAGKIRLREYFPQWLSGKKNLTPATTRSYADAGRLRICPSFLGDLSIANISRDDVRDWIDDFEAQEVGYYAIAKAHSVLRTCLEDASLDGKAIGNPAHNISIRKEVEREPFFLMAGQVEAIANEVPERDRALVYLLAYTGARIGEASALRVKNLVLLKKRVQVVESSAEVAGRKMPPGKTKTKRTRAIQLSDELVAELSLHLERFGQRLDGQLDPESWVFTGERGAAVRQGNWRARVFQPACSRLNIVRGPTGDEVPRVHDLRHTAASLAASAGFSLHEVKEMLGHTTIKTTSDRYLHLFEKSMSERAGSLGQLMAAARASSQRVVPLRSTNSEQAS